MRKFILGVLLLFYPLVSNAIFHNEGISYCFQHKVTQEIKCIHDSRDQYEGYFSTFLGEYLDGKDMGSTDLFQNWNFVRVSYYRREKHSYLTQGIFYYDDLKYFTRDRTSTYTTKNKYVTSKRTEIKSNKGDIGEFSFDDLILYEKVRLYGLYLALNYLKEYVIFLPINILVFFMPAKVILNKYYKIKKIKLIFFLSMLLYLLSDLFLYGINFGHSQVMGNLGGFIFYGLFVLSIKFIFFCCGIVSLMRSILEYRKKTKA